MVDGKVKMLFDGILGPERKTWVRIVDALLILGCAFAVALLYFGYAPDFEARLLHYLFYASPPCLVVIAAMLYRRTDISRLERIAILLLVLTLILALLAVVFDRVAQS